MQRVVCAALRHPTTGEVILGVRHMDWHMHQALAQPGRKHWKGEFIEQGFVDNHGKFLTRKEAWVVAEKADQIQRRCGADGLERHGLFSENLY